MNLKRRRRVHEPVNGAPTGLHTYDLGAKPAAVEQLVPAHERVLAEQAAINDAAANTLDTPSVLAANRPLGFKDTVDALMALEEGESRIRRRLAALVSRVISTSVLTGRDDAARESGVGLPGWRRRLDQAREREARAEQVLSVAEQKLVERRGEIPASHGMRTLALLVLVASWAVVVAVTVEAPVVRVAMELATASEDWWEPWALSGLTLLGACGVPHAVAHGLRTVRWAGGGRWIWPLIALGVAVWGTVVWHTAGLRAYAAGVDTGDGSGATGFQWTGDGGTVDQAPLGLEAGGPDLRPLFLGLMIAMSVLVFLRAFTGHTGEQIGYVRAARALDGARTVVVQTEAAVAEIEARLALQEADELAGEQASEEYAATLPALGRLLYAEYEAQLLRSVADPSFTDAVRALGSRLAAEAATESAAGRAAESGSAPTSVGGPR